MRWLGKLVMRREFNTAENIKAFEDAGRGMDKHTLMHCIVSMVSDRKDLTDVDRRILCLRLGGVLSETPRPDRK